MDPKLPHDRAPFGDPPLGPPSMAPTASLPPLRPSQGPMAAEPGVPLSALRSPGGFLLTALGAVPAALVASTIVGVVAFKFMAWASGWEYGQDSDEGSGLAVLIFILVAWATIGCGMWLGTVRWAKDRFRWPGRSSMTAIAAVALIPTSLLLGLSSLEVIERIRGISPNGLAGWPAMLPGAVVGLVVAGVIGGVIRASRRVMWTVLVSFPLVIWIETNVWFATS